jgi:cytosine deaminase
MTSLILRNAKIAKRQNLVDISIEGTKITSIKDVKIDNKNKLIGAVESYDAKGNFICSGFYESHIHLDKACILDRCSVKEGTLKEAVDETSKAKEAFTEEDVFERASKVIEMAIKKGTVGLRTFVETDEKTELRSFEAIKKAQDKYAFAIDIEICAFAQSGLTTKPLTHIGANILDDI